MSADTSGHFSSEWTGESGIGRPHARVCPGATISAYRPTEHVTRISEAAIDKKADQTLFIVHENGKRSMGSPNDCFGFDRCPVISRACNRPPFRPSDPWRINMLGTKRTDHLLLQPSALPAEPWSTTSYRGATTQTRQSRKP
jgi:hypothetical protein